MKVLKRKKGFTLLEVILAIAIFAAITMPLFTVFVQSIKVNKTAGDVFNANYISQDYIEKLDTVTYAQALADLPANVEVDGYIFSARIKPYGTLNSLFDQQCSYVHIIMFNDGKALCVMPDGKWHLFASIPSSFSFNISSGTYSFSGGFTSLSGKSEYSYCALIVNAMNKPDATQANITLGTNCKAALYCKEVDSGEITFSGGSSSVYESMITGNTSLVCVTTTLYDPSGENHISTSDSYINIRNW